jgi:alpha-glucosidase
MINTAAVFPGLETNAEWWRGATIYQVYPRSFSDSNGDGIGDLPGVTARLDYIASLGVDALWVSPFFKSPMHDFGYDVSDYCAVDPIFGTLADFDALIMRAHQLGLKVLIDQVYAHTSSEHPWFAESRSSRTNAKADWYVWADAKADGSPPNNWQSVFGGPSWTWDARRGQYYMHNFLSSQPQINGHNLDVQDAILDVARFWLDRGVDGFRVDAINFLMHNRALTDNPAAPESNKVRTRPFDFQQKIHNQSQPEILDFINRFRTLMDEYDARFTVAEVGGEHSETEMKAYTVGNTRFDSAYGFNFLYADVLTPALVREAVEAWPNGAGAGWPSWAFSNHDAPRWISRWSHGGDSVQFARVAMLLFACLRGNIIIWQGEELGLTQVDIAFEHLQDPEAIANWPLTLSRDGTRTPMPWQAEAVNCGFSAGKPWLPLGSDHAAMAVDRQVGNPDSMLEFTRSVIAFRRENSVLQDGSIKITKASGDCLAFERQSENRVLLCVFNLGAHAIDWSPEQEDHWHIIRTVGTANILRLEPFSGYVAQKN